MTRKNLSGQRRVTPILPMLPEAEGWRRTGRPVEPGRLQASLRGCNAEATRCNRAGDTAWAPRSSAGRTAGSAGPRRRNAQLRWAMRGQDPPDTGSMKYALIPLFPFAAFLIIGLFGHWIRERAHWIAVPAVGISFLLSAWIFTEVAKGEPIH